MAKIDGVQEVAITKLKPYERNARIHSDEQVKMICKSIQEFGFISPCLITKDNEVIAGHGRLEAAKQLGLKKVPCVYIEGLTEEQYKAYVLVDNKLTELGEWDMDLLTSEMQSIDIDMTAFGFETEDEPEIEIDDDDFKVDIDTTTEAETRPGEIYKLGRHYLMCGDATDLTDVKKLTDGINVDLLMTDPPYNVGLGYNETPEEAKLRKRRTDGKTIANDEMDDDEFYNFLLSFYRCADAVMKEGAAFYIWHADSQGLVFRAALEDAGFQIRQTLIWNKSRIALGRQDYQWKHEPCLYGWKDGAPHYFKDERWHSTVIDDKIDFDKLKKNEAIELLKTIFDGGISTTVINHDKPAKSEIHPTMKPIPLIAQLIRNSTQPDDAVLDLFGGSGTTMIACEQLGRTCYMMELDPHYCDAIIKRYEDYTGDKVVKVNG